MWSRSVAGENFSQPGDMVATRDGGFLVVADTDNAFTTNKDIEAIKFDSAAAIEWVGIYTGASDESAYWVK